MTPFTVTQYWGNQKNMSQARSGKQDHNSPNGPTPLPTQHNYFLLFQGCHCNRGYLYLVTVLTHRVLCVGDPGELDVVGVGRGEDARRRVDDEDQQEASLQLKETWCRLSALPSAVAFRPDHTAQAAADPNRTFKTLYQDMSLVPCSCVQLIKLESLMILSDDDQSLWDWL